MKKLYYIILLIAGIFSGIASFACTSVIISASKTASGRPLMLKNRDTGNLENRIEYFQGAIYNFIGLVNSDSEGGEVWAGTNSAGFCIMNTASYNLKDDDVPESLMDREGSLMFRALGVCATVKDFENFLDNISKPRGIEANFGVIDSSGGAAYYEVDNYGWVKYDVNEIPEGYRVVTNFSESGRPEDYKGYERWLTASEIMKEFEAEEVDGLMDISPHDILYGFSRSYRSAMTGIDWLNGFHTLKRESGFNGIIVDQDFIPRRSTSASIIFEGVKPGEDPLHTIMWTTLGYPCCAVTVPLLVGDSDMIPSFMKSSADSRNAWMNEIALKIKENSVFRFKLSNGSSYLDLGNVLDLLHSCLVVESRLEGGWRNLYGKWTGGSVGLSEFKEDYSVFCNEYFEAYLEEFASFIQ
jgi:hypothetical protein